MKKAILLVDAKKIEAELKNQKFDFELGYDKEGLLHILCAIDDEIKISEIIDGMKLPYKSFMWYGSFASDAIVEELSA